MNIFDFTLQYSFSDVLISIILFVLSFVAFFYFGFFRESKEREKENHKFKDMLIEGYFHKFDEYNEIISDLRTKLDMIEMKINPANIRSNDEEFVSTSDIGNKRSHRDMSHTMTPVTKDVIITEKKGDVNEEALRLNTVDTILRMLEVPLTSREIQRKINKSREHTSRLLKKLYSENIVTRDGSTRPFKYKITNEGRKLLEPTANLDG
ncbi:MAG: helix-turn-helix domain-containing protein [Nitrososphaerota archaeon]